MAAKFKMAAICAMSNNKLINFPQNSSRFVFLVFTMRFSGQPDIMIWLQRNLGHCIVDKIKGVQGQTINLYHFLQKSRRFVILVSTMRFSGTSDIAVWPEHTLGLCIQSEFYIQMKIFLCLNITYVKFTLIT